jgi:hypothetical protein
MVLALMMQGHQIEDRLYFYMFLTIIGGGDICRVTLGNGKNFIKGMRAIETKVVYFSLLIRKVIVSL